MNNINRLIVKTGRDLVFSTYCNENELLITLNGKWKLKAYSQHKNNLKLFIDKDGEDEEIDLRWVSEVHKVILERQIKDQLTFRLVKNEESIDAV